MPSTPNPQLAESIRTRNERRCERLLSRSELLVSSDLDWSAAGDVELDPSTLATLVYMRDVEGFTPSYLEGFGSHPTTTSDPLVARFFEVWEAEEIEHARALDRFLGTYARQRGIQLPVVQPPPPATVSVGDQAMMALSRPVGHVVTATHMAWGAVNELLTMNGYRMLSDETANPVLGELLSRIAAQEARHYGFYYLQAEWRLADSRLARGLVPRLLRRAWTPVGVGQGFKRMDEFAVVSERLARTPGATKRLATMDRTINRLPGLGALRLFGDAVDGLHAGSSSEVSPTSSRRGRNAAPVSIAA